MIFRGARRTLLLGTAVAVTGFAGYGRSAYAACVGLGFTYQCSGTDTSTLLFTADNATVSTLPGFSVNTTPPAGLGGNAIEITAGGDISFTDTNQSVITGEVNGIQMKGPGSPNGGNISVDVTGDVTGKTAIGIYARNEIGVGDIEVTTGTGSVIYGKTVGIRAANYANGGVTVEVNGDVTGKTTGSGIFALNSGTDLKVITGVASNVYGYGGIAAYHSGSGAITIEANGTVTGSTSEGISASGGGTNLTVTTGVGSNITGQRSGISASHGGTGLLLVEANGTVTGKTAVGIDAQNFSAGAGLKVVTGTESDIYGSSYGIRARNRGAGALTIDVKGAVTGGGINSTGIYAKNYAGSTDLSVTTGGDSVVTGGRRGIDARNFGSGGLSVDINGDVSGRQDGVYARNFASGTNLTMKTGADSSVYGKYYGFRVRNEGTGAVNVTVDGQVTSKYKDAVWAFNSANGTDLEVTTGTGSVIGGADNGIKANNAGSGNLTIDVGGQVTGKSNDGINARNYGADTEITTAVDSTVNGNRIGIYAQSEGLGAITIEANGDVTGDGSTGIFARNSNSLSAGNIAVTTGDDSTILGDTHGIEARNYGLGSVTVEARGDVTGSKNTGIFARISNASNDKDVKVTTTGDTVVDGGQYGVFARTYGTGDVIVDVHGIVRGKNNSGIYATKSTNGAGGVSVTTGTRSYVRGGTYGIRTDASGNGLNSVNVQGSVTGDQADGIAATNFVANQNGGVEITTGAGSTITGETNGIRGYVSGQGHVAIDVSGDVTGTTGSGIAAGNRYRGSGVTVTTDAGSNVRGGKYGILALNAGYYGGDLRIEAEGAVTGADINGITAVNNYASASLYVTAGARSDIFGAHYGVYADIKDIGVGTTLSPDGTLSVEVNGDVTGLSQSGVFARNNNVYATGTLSVTAGSGSDVYGGNYGIRAVHYGLGNVTVNANGAVTGKNKSGIYAKIDNSASDGDLMVTTGSGTSAYGDEYGMIAVNNGTGGITVRAGGDITGDRLDGIYASSNNPIADAVSVTTLAGSRVTGDRHGVNVNSSGLIGVEINGDASGYDSGLRVQGYYSSPITIHTNGHVFNRSESWSDLAVDIEGGETALNNGGLITGRVETTVYDDVFTNRGTWDTNDVSDFSDGEDELDNQGLIHAGGTEGVADVTRFTGLEVVRGGGTISMVDEAAFGGSNISDSLILESDLVGEGGTLAIDAFLGGPGSLADVLTVTEDISGTTYVVVNDTNDSYATYNPDGILVAVVEGPAQASNFQMANGPVSNGLYSYDIVYEDGIATDRFLLKNFAGLHAFEVAAVVSGSQNIFFDSTQGWVERQNQLRDRHARGTTVMAVADPPMMEDSKDAGLWVDIRGSTTERDAENGTTALNKTYTFDTGYDQDMFSVTGGADFGTNFDGATMMFGVMGGYFTSNQDMNSSTTSIDYEGGSIGAYATLLAGGFFADVLGKADFFTVDYDAASPGDDSDTSNGRNLGLRADAGYRFGSGGAYLEPIASVAAVWTTIDDFSLYNSTAEPGTNDAVQIGGGARAGWNMEAATFSVTGRVWDALGNDNEVGLEVPGTPVDTVTDSSFSGVFGEVSAQAGYRLGETAEAHLAASYFFNDEQTTLAAAAGMSFNW